VPIAVVFKSGRFQKTCRNITTQDTAVFRSVGDLRADVAIYDVAVFNYHFGLDARNNSNYNPHNEDMAIYAVIKNQISIWR
jgi:hypothetical protein